MSVQVGTGLENVERRERARTQQADVTRAGATELPMQVAENDARAATAARQAAELRLPDPEVALDALPKPCELAH